MERAKVVLVVLEDGVQQDDVNELVSAFALFRAVKGVARSEADGVFDVEIPRRSHEPLWEAFRRLEIKFEEKP